MQVRRGSRAPYQAICARGGGIGGRSLTESQIPIYLCTFRRDRSQRPAPSPYPPLQMSFASWHPTDDQLNDEITPVVRGITEDLKELQKELGCPDYYIRELIEAVVLQTDFGS